MDANVVQLIIAGIGVTGTLTAAILTQILARRSERKRQEGEDRARWLTERLRGNSQFLSNAIALERDIWSAAAQLDRGDREERMPGFKSILLTPEKGLPGVFDELTRTIIVEAIEEAYAKLDSMELLLAEIVLIGTQDEGECARALHEALWVAAGSLESYVSFDNAYQRVLAARTARDRFAEAARSGLRVDGEPIQPDRRPRLEADLPRRQVKSRVAGELPD